MFEDIFTWHRQKFRGFGSFKNRKFGEYLCKMPPKKMCKRRGSQETERISTRARSPEVDELSCVPKTQQAGGVQELVAGVEDPLERSDTGDIGLETQQESDISDEDTQDTQAAAATTQKGKGTDKGKTDKKNKKPPVFSVLSRNRS